MDNVYSWPMQNVAFEGHLHLGLWSPIEYFQKQTKICLILSVKINKLGIGWFWLPGTCFSWSCLCMKNSINPFPQGPFKKD